MIDIKDNNIVRRWDSESPAFWKSIGRKSLIIGSIIGIIGGALTPFIPAIYITILVTSGTTLVAIGQFFAKLTTSDKKVIELEKIEQEGRKHKRHVKRELRKANKSK